MDPLFLSVILMPGLPLAMAGYLFYRGARDWRAKRLIENIPRSKIRSAAIGLVELSGQARACRVLYSPVTGRACCWWSCKVEEPRTDSENRTRWHTLQEARSEERFVVEDETGCLLIDPRRADVHAPAQTMGVEARHAAQLEAWGVRMRGLFGLRSDLRLTEKVIPDQSPLYVLGELAWQPDAAAFGAPHPVLANVHIQAPARGFYVLSIGEEKSIRRKLAWRGPLLLAAGVLLLAFSWIALQPAWSTYQQYRALSEIIRPPD